MNIRPAKLADASAFAQISAETFALACPPDTKPENLAAYIQSELNIQKFEHYLASPSKLFFTVEVDQATAGYLLLSIGDAPSQIKASKPLELQRIYVSQKYHGTGIAQALFQTALGHAMTSGHDTMWLGVSKHNARALTFYRKQGFVPIGKQSFPVGDEVHEDLILSRPIKSWRDSEKHFVD